jgi:predicted amidohydrolase
MASTRVAFVQGRPRFGHPEENLERGLALAAGVEADLVVLPELWSSGYVFSSRAELAGLAEDAAEGVTARMLRAAARRQKRHLVAGFPEVHRGRFYNSCMLVGPSGVKAVYRKVHLFEREQLFFRPGDIPFAVHRVGPAKVGLLICFDWRFPEAARVLALQGADIIAHPSNLVFPDAQRIMVIRAFENRLFVVTANRTGVDDRPGGRVAFTGRSQVVDPRERVLARAGVRETCARAADCDLALARDKALTPLTHLFTSRQPRLYKPLADG